HRITKMTEAAAVLGQQLRLTEARAQEWERLAQERSVDTARLSDELAGAKANAEHWRRHCVDAANISQWLESWRVRWKLAAKRWHARVREYDSAICWETSCLNCSKLLDDNYA